MAPDTTRDHSLAGAGFALAAYTLWGFLPAYWKALDSVGPAEILAHRVVWSLLFTAGLLAARNRLGEVRGALAQPKQCRALFASGALIALNWGMFIWAVFAGRLVEASFGYYLNPLVNVAFGVAVLGETLSRAKWLAIGVAALGVVVLGVGSGQPPWLPLALAATFASYGLVRKLTPVSSLAGLAVETGLLAPLAAGYLVWLALEGTGALGRGVPQVEVMLVLAGPVTALPLIFFASAARRLHLSTLGLFQYLAPTLSFLLAIGVYGEPFTPVRGFAFGCIWAAVALYAADSFRAGRLSEGELPLESSSPRG